MNAVPGHPELLPGFRWEDVEVDGIRVTVLVRVRSVMPATAA